MNYSMSKYDVFKKFVGGLIQQPSNYDISFVEWKPKEYAFFIVHDGGVVESIKIDSILDLLNADWHIKRKYGIQFLYAISHLSGWTYHDYLVYRQRLLKRAMKEPAHVQ
jgi:hypothetical protein